MVDAEGGEPMAIEGLWVSVDWSPDGERLLLLGSPEREGNFDLYTARPDGTDLVQLTFDQVTGHEPSWSPDGSRIVFAAGAATFQDVYVIGADGSAPRRLTDWEGVDLFPVWSPDGAWIAFASDREASPAQQEANRSGDAIFSGVSLYVMRPDGTGVTRILEADAALPLSWVASG
jgi:Tol biopolymer transport system component